MFVWVLLEASGVMYALWVFFSGLRLLDCPGLVFPYAYAAPDAVVAPVAAAKGAASAVGSASLPSAPGASSDDCSNDSDSDSSAPGGSGGAAAAAPAVTSRAGTTVDLVHAVDTGTVLDTKGTESYTPDMLRAMQECCGVVPLSQVSCVPLLHSMATPRAVLTSSSSSSSQRS